MGLLEASWEPKWVLKGAQRSQKSSQDAPTTPPRAPETRPTRRNHDPSALSTFQSLRSHDQSALPSDYERREALERAAKSRSIGPVDVSEPPGAQNSNSEGVEAPILDTFIVFELPEGPLGPLQFDPPGIPSKHQGRGIRQFSSKTSILLRRELDFRFPRKSTRLTKVSLFPH